METFWQTISEYNSHTWHIQAVATLLAAAAVAALYRRPTAAAQRCMRLLLAALSFWTATAYYFIYCSPREYNTALGVFWLIIGGIWLYGALKKGPELAPVRRHRTIAPIIMAVPLTYPLISLARGMAFPQTVTPIMPCGLAVFTVGVILAFSPRPSIFILMMMFHWAIIGIFKIRRFAMPEDIVAVIAIVTAVFIIFRDYLTIRRDAPLKPRPKHISRLACAICALILALLIYVMASC